MVGLAASEYTNPFSENAGLPTDVISPFSTALRFSTSFELASFITTEDCDVFSMKDVVSSL